MKTRLWMTIVAISAIIIIGGITFASNVLFDLNASQHIQKIDSYILEKIDSAPGLETRINELHICQKLHLYGVILSAEDYSNYDNGKSEEPYSEEQLTGTEKFMDLHRFNNKVSDDLNCGEIRHEWEIDEFSKFQANLLDSNFDSDENYSFLYGNSKIQSVEVIIPLGAVIEGNMSLIPEEVTVVLGINNTVTWTNHDDTAHGITSDNGGDDFWGSKGSLRPGDSFSVTFYSAGIYEYYGQPHPWITGKVIVLEN
ncbi:MAG: cupredoxin domain-containing protein [Candidatus Nitrosopumilus sp. bin_68KS]